MAGIRDQFYSALRAEFQDGPRESFLYQYLKREKESGLCRDAAGLAQRTVRKRDDAYVRIQEQFLALKRGEICEPAYWQEFLALLARNSKLHLEPQHRQLLWRWAESGGVSLEGIRRNQQRYERLQEALEAGMLPSMGMERLTPLHEALLHCLLMADANTFLYDAGCPALGGPVSRRKKDRVMDMLEAYCTENGLVLQAPPGPGGTAGGLSKEEKAQYEAFFQTLRTSSNRRVLVPLQLDPATGAGLYIIGKDYFRGTSLYRTIRGACCYACLFWDDLTIERDYGVSFSCSADEAQLAEVCNFPHLEEALEWYHRTLQQEAPALFRASNGPPPENCPPALRRCFEPRRTVDVDPEELRQAREAMEREAAAIGGR